MSAESDLASLRDVEKVGKSLVSQQERLLRMMEQVDELRGYAHKQLGSLYRAEVGLQRRRQRLLPQQLLTSALPSAAARWTSTSSCEAAPAPAAPRNRLASTTTAIVHLNPTWSSWNQRSAAEGAQPRLLTASRKSGCCPQMSARQGAGPSCRQNF